MIMFESWFLRFQRVLNLLYSVLARGVVTIVYLQSKIRIGEGTTVPPVFEPHPASQSAILCIGATAAHDK